MPAHCPSCGYDVAALLGAGPARCPECGRELSPRTVLDFARRPWWWYAAALPLTLLPGVLMIAPIFLRRASDDRARFIAPYLAFLALGAALPYLARWTRAALRAHGLSAHDRRAPFLTGGLFLYNLFLAGLAWLVWGAA